MRVGGVSVIGGSGGIRIRRAVMRDATARQDSHAVGESNAALEVVRRHEYGASGMAAVSNEGF